ncbi:hypothetical protein [Bacillus phage phiAGATE]|uniref:Uncharacterized protein n=1 Tax=Bacillus phage phiAGATE TaxID=1204533 RepID=L0L984_9CAUD|nr:hypothetical protein G380_gp058 [Bacillus phage phiAGATE]AGB62708.1 hypothetical protein [Bacillus phage phiAGATE]
MLSTLLLLAMAVVALVFLIDLVHDLISLGKSKTMADVVYHWLEAVKSTLAVSLIIYIGLTM